MHKTLGRGEEQYRSFEGGSRKKKNGILIKRSQRWNGGRLEPFRKERGPWSHPGGEIKVGNPERLVKISEEEK